MGNEQDDKNHRPRVESTDDEKKSSTTTKVKKVPLPIKAALLIGVVLFLLPKIHIFDLIPYLVIVFLFMIVSLFTVAAGELGDQDGGPYFFYFWLIVFVELLLKTIAGDTSGHGRPFRVNGRLLLASVLPSSDWVYDSQPVFRELDSTTRRALQSYWLHSAVAEHASVASFSNLCMQLIALGAGPDLLKKVLEAASQEVEHARVCFSTATYFSAEMVSPAGIPEIMSSQGATPSLRKLIEDCFFDGCIMESFSANLARKSSDLTTDSHSKNAFSLIARDEESHGELSWEILAFLIKEDKASVQSLRSQISLVRDISGPQMFPENVSEQFRAVDENILRRFGILDQKIVIDIWSATLSKTEERIEKWLCAISSESDNCINLEAG